APPRSRTHGGVVDPVRFGNRPASCGTLRSASKISRRCFTARLPPPAYKAHEAAQGALRQRGGELQARGLYVEWVVAEVAGDLGPNPVKGLNDCFESFGSKR